MTQQQHSTQDLSVLDQLVEQAFAAHLEAEAQQQREKDVAQEALLAQSQQAFEERFVAALTLEFIEHIAPLTPITDGREVNSVRFQYLGRYWTLSNYGHDHMLWSINIAEKKDYSGTTMDSAVPGTKLQSRLLAIMGKHRQEVLEKEAKAAVDKAQHDENMKQHELRQKAFREQQKREEDEREVAQQQRIAVADAEHARLTTLLEEKCIAAKQEMWHWPTGVTIEVYWLQWCKGSAYNSDNEEQEFDYDQGWTAASSFDEQGRIRIEPTTKYYSPDTYPVRTIQLMQPVIQYHPVWTVHRYSSLEELPDALQQETEVSLPNVVWERDYNCCLDGENRLVQVDHLQYKQTEASLTVGKVPLPWIQALVVESVVNGE